MYFWLPPDFGGGAPPDYALELQASGTTGSNKEMCVCTIDANIGVDAPIQVVLLIIQLQEIFQRTVRPLKSDSQYSCSSFRASKLLRGPALPFFDSDPSC